jgi:hypothetical protein
MIFIVYCTDYDSSSGVSITGIFDDKTSAFRFALSEGAEYQVFETTPGPIDWKGMSPLPPFDWNNL